MPRAFHLTTLFSLYFLHFFFLTAAPAAPLDVPASILAGFELLRNGHYSQGLETARRLESEFPAHPLPPLLAAHGHFDLIFCQTGHINSKEIWHEALEKSSPLDAGLEQAVARALALSEKLQRQQETAALGAFYSGVARGLRARLLTLREQTLPSGREGQQMRAALLKAIKLDPALEAEAEIGLGLYNYYADSLSPLLKLVRFFLLIPGGSVEQGIAQLRSAAEPPANALADASARPIFSHSKALFSAEARWELARILGVREYRHPEAVELLQPLVVRYPDNALYALLAALEAEQSGNLPLAQSYAQRAVEAAARMDPSCRPRLEPAAKQAADRIIAAISVPRP